MPVMQSEAFGMWASWQWTQIARDKASAAFSYSTYRAPSYDDDEDDQPCRLEAHYSFFGYCVRSVVDKADKEDLPIYLETGNPRNVPWYEKFGFATVYTEKAGFMGPTVYYMRRYTAHAHRTRTHSYHAHSGASGTGRCRAWTSKRRSSCWQRPNRGWPSRTSPSSAACSPYASASSCSCSFSSMSTIEALCTFLGLVSRQNFPAKIKIKIGKRFIFERSTNSTIFTGGGFVNSHCVSLRLGL